MVEFNGANATDSFNFKAKKTGQMEIMEQKNLKKWYH